MQNIRMAGAERKTQKAGPRSGVPGSVYCTSLVPGRYTFEPRRVGNAAQICESRDARNR
ncbi:hypothetical protein CC1G_15461 [Coprinopsis cinerea okayama7|uniref:Uncharacterized protein n=1 Tax=Coprinopsis cinerea (strain Okayama-7 / 130 / ATCC MYA-4618 / FGSC 9003) TaxID=240176 RepID=D6RQQ3_COPC7|nr:hypothetical protein CC1G_15461 [Coprinopsis cinerea okayama7\|eukprot:XP_002910184.1 hypothetical protein CC1G_15461 [Coprinopsis cinerea okayama7\